MGLRPLLDRFGRLNFRFKSASEIEEEVTVDRLNAMLDAINGNAITGVVNGDIRSNGIGKTIICGSASGGSTSIFPYKGIDASDKNSGKVQVLFGTHNSVPPQINGLEMMSKPTPTLTLSNSAKIVYVEFDFAFDVTGAITSYPGRTIQSTNSALIPAQIMTFATDGSGSGSFFQALFGVHVNAPTKMGGSYSVDIGQSIRSSQGFVVCGSGVQVSSIL